MLSGGHLLIGKVAFLENVPSTGTFEKVTKMSNHFLLSPHSSMSWSLCRAVEHQWKNKSMNTTNKSTMILMALESV